MAWARLVGHGPGGDGVVRAWHGPGGEDLTQRQLDLPAAALALNSLQDRGHFLRRHVDVIMLSKGLFLWYQAQKTPFLCTVGTFEEVIEKATRVLTSKGIDKYALKTFGCTQEEADALAAARLAKKFRFG